MLIPASSEEARLVALRASGLLDELYEQDVADLVGLAAQLCQTPHAAISVLDAMWEWEPSGGRMTRIRPRSQALGAWITTHQGPRVVADIRADPLFQEKLASAPSCGFYAGVPLIQHDGFALGTLYVTDVIARTLTDRQIAALGTLSRQIMAQFAWRQPARSGDWPSNEERSAVPAAMHPAWEPDHHAAPVQHVLARMQAVHDLFQHLLRVPSREVLVQQVLHHITDTFPCSCVRIVVHDLDMTATRQGRSDQPDRCGPVVLAHEPSSVPLEVPVIGADQQIGALRLDAAQVDGFSATDAAIAQSIATLLAGALEHIQLVQHVQAGRDRLAVLSRRLIAVQEDERRHLARELHDEIGQALTAIRINLQHVYGALPSPQDKAYAQDGIAIVHQLVQQVRTLSLDLRPSMLDDLGLISAVRWYLNRQAQRSGLCIDFIAAEDVIDLDPTVATACFRIVQESLTNILRHAAATAVTVELEVLDALVAIRIQDDGRGFDPAILERGATGERFGLLGMQERAALVGGTCTIQTTVGAGTLVWARVPRGAMPLNRRRPGRFAGDAQSDG